MVKRGSSKTILEKTQLILKGLFVAFFLILVRVWTLAVVFHDEKVAESRRPQKKRVVERAERASIYDRFGMVLATNQIQYNVGICYGPMRSIPRTSIKKVDDKGGKMRIFPRKEYITALSELLAEELGMDPERIEDVIYSKAAILGNAPYILKEGVSEPTYFRMKILEKDWPGIVTEVGSKRIYPQGRTAGEIVGYLGPMSQKKYKAFIEEMKEIRESLAEDPAQEELQLRLQELEKLAYTINDLTGKIGIEATCDDLLRGKNGKKVYLADVKGSLLQETEDSVAPVSGQAITLTLSCELQNYAERLLAEYSQQLPMLKQTIAIRKRMPQERPWVKEGAIVALDPHSGEVLALASFPRYDPNDFILKQDLSNREVKNWQVSRWLETEDYVGGVWDRITPLVREKFDCRKGEFYDEEQWLDWFLYLDLIVSQQSPLLVQIKKFDTIGDSVKVQQVISELASLFEPLPVMKIFDLMYASSDHVRAGSLLTFQDRELYNRICIEYEHKVQSLQAVLDPYFQTLTHNIDKLLMVDLYRLFVNDELFREKQMESEWGRKIADYYQANGQFAVMQSVLKQITRELFHSLDFKTWRQNEFKDFLAKKRKEERQAKIKYAKPYLDYLDQEEQGQFDMFWQAHHMDLMKCFLYGESNELLAEYGKVLKMWHDELRSGAHHALFWFEDYRSLKYYLESVDVSIRDLFLKTLRTFSELNRPLYGSYPFLRCDGQGGRQERHLAMAFYPRYGYGHLRSYAFRQAAVLGSIFKLVPGYAALMQLYKSGAHGPLNPLTIIDNTHKTKEGWNVGSFSDGRPIPIYYHGGRLPRSDHRGIGRIDVSGALETSSNPYFSLLASEVLQDPEDLCAAARLFGFGEKTGIELTSEYSGSIPQDVSYNRTGLYSMAIGQHTLLTTPLQTAVMLSSLVNGGKILQPKVLADTPTICRRQIPLPEEVKLPLLEGMRRVVQGEKGTARFVSARCNPSVVAQTIGKTSTSEVVENYGCDALSRYIKTKAVWFGAIIFDQFREPELVVVVYLRQGEYGNLAMPYTVKIAQKWREILEQNK